MKRYVVSLIGFLVLGANAWAQTPTPALGPVYPITEPDLLELLETHAREEREGIKARLEDSKATLKAWREAPKGQVLPVTTESQRRVLTVSHTKDFPGDFYRRWLMIDATDAEQLAFAKDFLETLDGFARVVLVNGNVREAQRVLKVRVWFDQQGVLAKRLDVKTVPTLIHFTRERIVLDALPLSKED